MVYEQVLFCTELIGLPVFDTRGRKIGRVKDAALVPIIDPTRVDRFLLGGGWAWLSIHYDQVRSISLEGISLKDEKLTPYHSDEYMLRIVRDLLDQQIIDSLGRKVVRVTDVTFEIKHTDGYDQLNVLEVDIGMRSIFRRLFQGVVPASWVRECRSRSRRTRSVGSTATSSNRTPSVDYGSTSRTRRSKKCTRPIWPTS